MSHQATQAVDSAPSSFRGCLPLSCCGTACGYSFAAILHLGKMRMLRRGRNAFNKIFAFIAPRTTALWAVCRGCLLAFLTWHLQALLCSLLSSSPTAAQIALATSAGAPVPEAFGQSFLQVVALVYPMSSLILKNLLSPCVLAPVLPLPVGGGPSAAMSCGGACSWAS